MHCDGASSCLKIAIRHLSWHLHGTVLGRLFTVEKSLRTVADLIPTTDAKSQLKEAIMEIDRTVRQIRTTVHELGSAEIDRNVRSQVLALVRALDPMVGFRVEVSFVGPVDSAIPIVLTEHLLATTREALTNIGRHARATAATIILSFEDGLCRLDITDTDKVWVMRRTKSRETVSPVFGVEQRNCS